VIRTAFAASLALALAACASVPDAVPPAALAVAPAEPLPAPAPAPPPHPEARAYAVTSDAMADVDAALARASASGKRVLLVMGANWCHDSRALAGWLETPRFAALVAERYELVFINVGMPQTGDGHNLDVARRFGLADVPGTPALLVLTAEGEAVNVDTAASWRNAASRSEDAIFAELVALSGTLSELAGAAPPGVMVHVRGGDGDGCQFALSPEGPWQTKVTDLPGTAEGLRFDLRATRETPWRCVAAGIHALQQSGAAVGFVSDPAG
jgi:hypothetical protein